MEKMEKSAELVFAILNKDDREFLGCAGLYRINTSTPEFGIWLKKSVHGQRYGLETVTAIKKWADENLTYGYILYPVDRDNIPSRKIPEKLGDVVCRQL